MTFVQIIDCKTDKVDEINRLMDAWAEQTRGKRTATHDLIGTDRSEPSHCIEIVEFPSYEDAVRTTQLPESDRIFREIVALCDEMPTFTDLEVVRDERLNKATARRFFDEVVGGRDLGLLEELCTADYRGHDPASEADTVGVEALRLELSSYLDAFDFRCTIEGQLAEGDQVTTRWTAVGTQTAAFLGVEPADGRRVTLIGHTTHRFSEGRIAEAWWNWDTLGLLRQLGLVEVV